MKWKLLLWGHSNTMGGVEPRRSPPPVLNYHRNALPGELLLNRVIGKVRIAWSRDINSQSEVPPAGTEEGEKILKPKPDCRESSHGTCRIKVFPIP